jgi:putative RecB family exonuclease
MPTFSISRIGAYRDCPRQYKFAYIERPPVEFEETVEAFLGSRVHEALEKLYRDKRHEKIISLGELLESYNRSWSDNWTERTLIVRNDYTAENYRLMGERYLSDYYRRYAPFEQGRVVGLETKETVALDDEGVYQLHIRIDRLVDMGEGLYEVHDYKTSSGLPGQEKLDQDVQLAAYALWVRLRFRDFRRVRLVWHYLAFDKELDSWRSDEDLENLRRELLRQVRAIEETTDFPPRVSTLCDWCLYRSLCPMWRSQAELEQTPENDYLNQPCVQLVDEYVRQKAAFEACRREADEKLAKLERALIALCAEELSKEKVSVLPGSENKVTIREVDQVKWPAKNTEDRGRLTAALKGLGLWDRVADLDPHALNRILKDDKGLSVEAKRAVVAFQGTEKCFRLTISKKTDRAPD